MREDQTLNRDPAERIDFAALKQQPEAPGGERYERSLSTVALACAVGLLALLAKPLWLGRVYVLNDLGYFHLPCRFFYQRAIWAGDSFLWFPGIYSGDYLHGEGQIGMLHPLHLLLYRFLPLHVAFNLELLASYAFMFPGMALFLRRLGLPRSAALFGAIVFTFGGFNMLHFIHLNAVAVLAHVPWLLWCLDLALLTTDRRKLAAAGAGIALLTGSQLLLGHPQSVWFSLIAEAAFVAWRCRTSRCARRLPRILAALVFGLLIGAAQLLPTMDALSGSMRGAPSLAFSVTYSLSPFNVIQLFSPFALKHLAVGMGDLHEQGLYNGVFCTVALFWLALRRGGKTRRLAAAVAAFGVVMLMLAFGRYAGVYALFARLPLLSAFRAPGRYVALVHLAMAVLAALAFLDLQELQRAAERPSWRSLRPLAIPLAISVAIFILSIGPIRSRLPIPEPYALASVYRTGLCAVWMLICTSLVLAAARGARWSLPAIVLFVSLDLGGWGLHYAWSVPDRTVSAYLHSARPLPSRPPGTRLFLPFSYGLCDAVTMEGVRDSGGYVGLEPASVLDVSTPLAQRISGTAWAFSMRKGHAHWTPVQDPLPRARLVTDARVSAAPAAALRQVDPARTAIVDRPLPPMSGPPGSATIVDDRPGRIAVETHARSPQLLVLSERFHPGWRVETDGRAVATLRVDGDFQGCVVPAGGHRATFRFDPASYRRGLLLSLAGLALTLGLFTKDMFIRSVDERRARLN
jgi:hypothetical protein